MISYKIRFTPEAAGLFSKLHPENKILIKAALQQLLRTPYSGHDLQEELSGFKSYRTKKYRILYKVNEEEQAIEIYYIGHRKDVYEQFRRLLNQIK
jgi:addiction module RelE/StbE family toxin